MVFDLKMGENLSRDDVGNFVSVITVQGCRLEGILGQIDITNSRITIENGTSSSMPSEIYKIGGEGLNLPSSTKVMVCNDLIVGKTWRVAPSMMVARKNAFTCSLDGRILFNTLYTS
ncbi:unnamed protein product [Cochlearia groenlandica]